MGYLHPIPTSAPVRIFLLNSRQIMRLQGGMKERAAEEARKIMQGAA